MPQTSMPPPPKHHGGGAFIGAVVVMLLAMGGLLYWKFAGKDAPPAPVVMPVPSVAKAPVFEEAPPPPPPAEPDAGKKEAPKKHLGSSGSGECGGTCKGDAPPALQKALAGAAGSARGCYERALRQNAMLQGKVVVAVRVGAHGGACGANVVSDTLGDPSVSTCVLQKFRSGSFPQPVGGCVEVRVPISFMPKTGGK